MLAYFLRGNESEHIDVRAEVVMYIRNSKELLSFAEQIEREYNDKPGRNPRMAYLTRMSTNGEFGGELEIVAAALKYKKRIIVHDSGYDGNQVEYPGEVYLSRLGPDPDTLHVFRTQTGSGDKCVGHYEAMEKKQRDESSSSDDR